MGLVIDVIRAIWRARKYDEAVVLVLNAKDKYDKRVLNYTKHTNNLRDKDYWYNQHGQGSL